MWLVAEKCGPTLIVGLCQIMSERKVIGIGAIVDKNMDTMDDVYCS
jgi:hypothetical protein